MDDFYLSESEYTRLVSEYMRKPSIGDVEREMQGIKDGTVHSDHVVQRYWFHDLRNDTVTKTCKYSVNDVLGCRELLSGVVEKCSKIGFFTKYHTDACGVLDVCGMLGTYFSLGQRFAKRAPAFPLKEAQRIIRKYCPARGNYYDPSCGWGNRLLASLSAGICYHGTDPNDLLFPRLLDVVRVWNLLPPWRNQSVDIRCQGSEVFVPEWEGKMDLCFTSPPYFDVEDYKHGNQSIKLHSSHAAWCEHYFGPTLENCYRYLKPGGVLGINIKGDASVAFLKKFALGLGFKKIDDDVLHITMRPGNGFDREKGGFVSSEGIYMFKKP